MAKKKTIENQLLKKELSTKDKSVRRKVLKSKKKGRKTVRKYQRIVSIIIANNKKKKIPYNISDVRKIVSEIYPNLKELPVSKLGIRRIELEIENLRNQIVDIDPDIVNIGTDNIPSHWFDDVFNFWDIGEHVVNFSNAYPEIPIVLKSQSNTLSVVGAMGTYDGSEAQSFVEVLREEMAKDNEGSSDFQLFYGTPTSKYAFWGSEGVEFPETIDFIQATGTTVEEIEIRESESEQREVEEKKLKKERKKKETTPLPKQPKSKPTLKKPTPKKKAPINKLEPTKDVRVKTTLGEKNRAIELLIKQFELDLIDKSEFKAEKKLIMDMYSLGGTIN